MSRDVVLRRVAGVSGIISQLVVLSAISVALYQAPWFSWTWNDLSALGVTGPTMLLFNLGFISSGILSMIFAIGLGKSLPPSRLARFGTYILILGSLGFSAVGLFPRDTDFSHAVVVRLFLVCVFTALILIGLSAVTSHRKWGLITLLVGVLMVTLQLVSWPWHGTAISKLLYSLPWSLWTIAFGVILLVKPSLLSVKRN